MHHESGHSLISPFESVYEHMPILRGALLDTTPLSPLKRRYISQALSPLRSIVSDGPSSREIHNSNCDSRSKRSSARPSCSIEASDRSTPLNTTFMVFVRPKTAGACSDHALAVAISYSSALS